MQNTGTPRNYLLSHSIFIQCVWFYCSAFRSKMGNDMCDITGFKDTITSQFYISFRLSLILHQTGHGHSHRAQTRETLVAPLEKPALRNASLRAAFVHAIGDLFQSISVLISALIIFFKVSFISSHAFLAIKKNNYFHSIMTLGIMQKFYLF